MGDRPRDLRMYMGRRRHHWVASGWAAALAVCFPRLGLADPTRPPELEAEQSITGKEEVERESGDTGRDVGNALLWLPRNVIDLLFRGTTAAANLIADQQLVPRYRELLGAPPGGDVLIFPTLFAETGGAFSVGARMIVDTEHITTTQRIGLGGLSDVAGESRVVFKGGAAFPAALSLELFYKLEDDIEYAGVGIVPRRDERNRFQLFTTAEEGLYTERIIRGISSLGVRLGPDLEHFMSASVSRRQIEPTEDAGPERLDEVFEPGSIEGVRKDVWLTYVEAAMRFDSRASRARPTEGTLIEAYLGTGHDLGFADDVDVQFLRWGGRVAGFFPIYRRSNILSPRIILDRVAALNGLPLPFYELERQPDFRGFDTRRDNISIVASLDYTWQLVPFMGMRLFLDGATVAPSFAEFSLEQLKNLRYAGGLGIDLYTDTAQIARFEVATSPEGVRLHFSVGASTGFGDRQHRE